jgi:hypothetical protein
MTLPLTLGIGTGVLAGAGAGMRLKPLPADLAGSLASHVLPPFGRNMAPETIHREAAMKSDCASNHKRVKSAE